MHDPALVGPSERLRQDEAEGADLLRRKHARADPVAERASLEERHDEVGPALRGAGVEERHEAVRLAEPREEAPLALEARDRRGVLRPEELDRDALAPGPCRLDDASHAALGDRADRTVGSDHASSPDSERRRSWSSFTRSRARAEAGARKRTCFCSCESPEASLSSSSRARSAWRRASRFDLWLPWAATSARCTESLSSRTPIFSA